MFLSRFSTCTLVEFHVSLLDLLQHPEVCFLTLFDIQTSKLPKPEKDLAPRKVAMGRALHQGSGSVCMFVAFLLFRLWLHFSLPHVFQAFSGTPQHAFVRNRTVELRAGPFMDPRMDMLQPLQAIQPTVQGLCQNTGSRTARGQRTFQT